MYKKQLFGVVSKTDTFTGDGFSKEFTLTKTPTTITTVKVAGETTTDYTNQGNKIAFISAPASDATISVKYSYNADSYDDGAYCDFSANASNAVAGKDILLAIWNATGDTILAIGGQQNLTINRSADSIEISSKDTDGGWKSYIAGMKEWSIDTDGIWIASDQSHEILSHAFENGDPVCLKVYNNKTHKGLFGGLAVITDYPIEAPYDDTATYSMTLTGQGALVDLTANPPASDVLPE